MIVRGSLADVIFWECFEGYFPVLSEDPYIMTDDANQLEILRFC